MSIWFDPWIWEGIPLIAIPSFFSNHIVTESRVSILISDIRQWDSHCCYKNLPSHIARWLLGTQPPSGNKSDTLSWLNFKNPSSFTVKEFYQHFLSSKFTTPAHPHLSRAELFLLKAAKKVPSTQRAISFLLKTMHQRLLVATQLFSRHCTQSDICQLCNSSKEDISHCLFLCTKPAAIWAKFSQHFRMQISISSTVQLWTLLYTAPHKSSEVGRIKATYLFTSLWFLWKDRCNSIFNPGNEVSTHLLRRYIQRDVRSNYLALQPCIMDQPSVAIR